MLKVQHCKFFLRMLIMYTVLHTGICLGTQVICWRSFDQQLSEQEVVNDKLKKNATYLCICYELHMTSTSY